jgi:ELWxxDGT repeat protein
MKESNPIPRPARALYLAAGSLLCVGLSAQGLLKDINPTFVNGNGLATTTTPVVVIGGVGYFAGNDGTNGVELWRTDGTAAGTMMLKDINSGVGLSSSPTGFVAFGSGFVFAATDAAGGNELWKSDGTPAGTVLVADIWPGASSSSPSGFTVLGSSVYFAATDSTATTGLGRELYKYDGTTVSLVADVTVGATSGISGTGNLTTAGGLLYFAASDNAATNNIELWKSDGTGAGTAMVLNINGTAGASSSPALITPFGAKVVFNANDGTTGIEPWVSDGTAAGTVRLMDINAATLSSSPTQYTVAGTKIFFSALESSTTGRELYVSDGTPAGTSLVVDLNPGTLTGASTIGFTAFGSQIVYPGTTPATGTELFLSDGTAMGTTLYADLWPGTGSGAPAPTFRHGGLFYTNATDGSFATGNFELMVTDGTVAGTRWVKDIWPGASTSDPQGFFVLGGALFFVANEGHATGIEIWTSDGTTAGTRLVKDINTVGNTAASSSPGAMVRLGGKAFFSANDGTNLFELWQTDGTAAGTTMLKDLNPIGSGSPVNFTLAGDRFFFSANNGTNGVELWVSDGTNAGTVMLKDINPGSLSSSPANLLFLNGRLYFSANDGSNGVEPWISDGTAAGTVMLKDVNPGLASASPTLFTPFGGKVYFRATEATTGIEPYITDGTAAGTLQLRDCYPGASSSSPLNATVSGNKLFFVATDGTATTGTGTELYVTDGTPAGTLLLEVQPGTTSGATTTAGTLVAYGGGVLFQGNNGTAANGAELWISDGTTAGTAMIMDVNAGTASSSPANMLVLNGRVVFSATTAATGNEPWATDGTLAGTVALGDFYPGTGSASPLGFAAAAGRAFFTAFDGTATTGTGRELYLTDATPGGTKLVKDIFVGTSSGCSANPFVIGAGTGGLVMANDGTSGIELFVSDGTLTGTALTFDLNPGTAGSGAINFAIAGNALVFSASNGTSTITNPAAVGTELWSIPLATLGIAVNENYGSGCPGTGGLVPHAFGDGAPVLGNMTFAFALNNARASAQCALLVGASPLNQPISACTLLVTPSIQAGAMTTASGTASITTPIPNVAALLGGDVYSQWGVVDPNGALFNVIAVSEGARIKVGK